MSRRDRIKNLYASTADTEKLAMANLSVPPERASERVPAGPVRSMGLALDRMERESRDLEKALVSGSAVVEIAPDLIDSSIVRDRLAPSDDVSFETLKQSIAERGQEVPISSVRILQTMVDIRSPMVTVASGRRSLCDGPSAPWFES